MKKHSFLAMAFLALGLVACPTEPPEPQGTELILNGGFEISPLQWQTFTENGGVAERVIDRISAKTGDGLGELKGVGPSANNYARAFFAQGLTIPNTGTTRLRFSILVNTTEDAGSEKDGLNVFVSTVNDPPFPTYRITSAAGRNQYITTTINLDEFKGQTVTVKFEAIHNESKSTIFRLDDVSVKHIP
jgi:serine protease